MQPMFRSRKPLKIGAKGLRKYFTINRGKSQNKAIQTGEIEIMR